MTGASRRAVRSPLPRRRAKIVATIGPSCSEPAVLADLLDAGMDVARLNLSHGSHAEHARVIKTLRRLGTSRKRPVAILADLPGPKIRTGRLADGRPLRLVRGRTVTLAAGATVRPGRIGISYRGLAGDLRAGNRVLLADGLIELRVISTRGGEVRCRVLHGGLLGDRKGVNLPGVSLGISAITAEDRRHLSFALDQEVDYIAESFVRSPGDVRTLKRLIGRAGKEIPVLAKIEKPEALEALDGILMAADGVMVARGDLGVEMTPEKVPLAQKRIIARANELRRPVITATQMLESMVERPRPTRAEASDVANAVLDGTDALMLSGETATGRYPCEAVRMMARIVAETERAAPRAPRRHRKSTPGVAETIAEAAAVSADQLGTRLVAVSTESGFTARIVSKARPAPPIVAFSPRKEVLRRMTLYWGVTPLPLRRVKRIRDLAREAERALRRLGLARKGDVIAFVAGIPLDTPGMTNLLKLHVAGS